jgi:hypothetical protein
VLVSTYLHIPGVGPKIERALWEQGARTWEDFLKDPAQFRIAPANRDVVAQALQDSRERLQAGDLRYFAERLPRWEAWRIFPEFHDKILYLDIETDGGWSGNSITVIGCYDGSEYRAFVKGKDLDDFEEYSRKFPALVTFFGTGFDIPMLRRRYPAFGDGCLHIDLCLLFRRLGFRGGLKSLERQLNLSRSEDVAGLNGQDAIYLWRQYLRGVEGSLERLIRYNREDVVNLERLMRIAYGVLRERTMF